MLLHNLWQYVAQSVSSIFCAQHVTSRFFGGFMAYISESTCFTHKRFLLFESLYCLVGSQSEVRLFFQSVIAAFFPEHFQLCNKSLITQACCDLHHKNIGPQSPLYGPCCTLSILSRPRTNIFPVWSSRLVNKIYIQCIALVYLYGIF